MSDVTVILDALRAGDNAALDRLLPVVYDELKRLAAVKLAAERKGESIQATLLVHEAYLRLVGQGDPQFETRGHFFTAAAEAMRRILIEKARKRGRLKRGGGMRRFELNELDLATPPPDDDLLALDDALAKLEQVDMIKGELVKLRFFGGLTEDQAARALGISRATAARYWTFARAWLYRELTGDEPN